MNKLSPEYVAGFLDGEGCIQLMRQRKKDRFSWSYRLSVEVTHTYKPVLQALHNQYGGRFGCYPLYHNNKQAYYWHATGLKAKEVLLNVLPYLIEKKDQAILGLKYLEEYTPSSRGYRVSEEQLALREEFYWALRKAKHK